VRGVAARVISFVPASNVAVLDDFEVVDAVVADNVVVTMQPDEAVQAATDLLPGTTPEQLGRLLMMAPLVEIWLKAVRAEGDRRMLAGQVVPGFKLVQGKRGARRWSDAEAAEQRLKAMRLKVEEMFDLSLISPTAAEKLTKAKDGEKPAIGPRQWAKLQTLIVPARRQAQRRAGQRRPQGAGDRAAGRRLRSGPCLLRKAPRRLA
jgi:hypothetical protein